MSWSLDKPVNTWSVFLGDFQESSWWAKLTSGGYGGVDGFKDVLWVGDDSEIDRVLARFISVTILEFDAKLIASIRLDRQWELDV